MQVKPFIEDHKISVIDIHSLKCTKLLKITQSLGAYQVTCKSLTTKLNLHKGRVRNYRLRILYWLQCGAKPMDKTKERSQFKLIPKELGSSECE